MPEADRPSTSDVGPDSDGLPWPPALRSALRNPYPVAGIVVLTLIAGLLPQVSSGPAEDYDMPVILERLRADHSLRAAAGWFMGDWVQHNGYYRPVASLSLWLDYLIWGENLWGYRLTNLIILALTTLALAWLGDTMTGTAWAGVLAGVLLMATAEGQYLFLHPATRTDGLCGVLLCLATAAGTAYVRRGRRAGLGLALAMFLLALWCKEVALIWPAFIAAASFVWGFPRRAALLGGCAFAVAAAAWLARVAALDTPLTGRSIQVVHYPLAGQLYQYASFLLSPILLHVVVAYPALEPTVYTLLGSRVYRLVLGDLWFLAANVLVFRDNLRTFCLLWAWRLVMYLPSLPFARVYPHYWYIPMLGTCLLDGTAAVVLVRWAVRRYGRGSGQQGGTAPAGPANQ